MFHWMISRLKLDKWSRFYEIIQVFVIKIKRNSSIPSELERLDPIKQWKNIPHMFYGYDEEVVCSILAEPRPTMK